MGMTSRPSLIVGENRREGRWLHRPGTGLRFSHSPIYKQAKLPKRVISFARPNTRTTNTSLVTNMAQNLLELLEYTCQNHPGKKILVYQSDSLERGPVCLSYTTLLNTAYERAIDVIPYLNVDENPVVLLHVNDHLQGIIWFWAVIAAGGIPCMSTAYSKDGTQRRKQLNALLELLANPLIITTEELASEFADFDNLRLKAIEELRTAPSPKSKGTALKGYQKGSDEVAVLMLTSGSTGNAKAVGLTNRQLLHAVVGKSEHHHTTEDDVFLNWTGLDHVANLTEIHLHAMSLGEYKILRASIKIWRFNSQTQFNEES
jgi:acyl-CoA synthetase (AMP-forming)/AMP-acid ligase II